MAPSFFRANSIGSYFGYGKEPATTHQDACSKSAQRALPASWYTSPQMYQLERRGIFSRKWQLITHTSRLQAPGDFLKFSTAGFEFIICKDRTNAINAFHNVCRHRAYPVVPQDSGTARIFSCKYHGWSYGLNGKLAKAPGYQDVPEFDKAANGLFPIHVHIDINGFIWVNLDASPVPEIAWEDDFLGIDAQARYADFDFTAYDFDHEWAMEGEYNWKILADNYNECYHCATTHPDIPAVANLETYAVETQNGKILHDPGTTPEQRAAGMIVASTYYFPNVSTNVTPHFFMIQRFVPLSPTRSRMQYQVFRNRNSSVAQFTEISDIYKRVMSEDKALCDAAQQNLAAGVFVNGELHPRLEKGPLHFQSVVRENVTAWARREREEGRGEIWPARQKVPVKVGAEGGEDEEFCRGLACDEKMQGQLEW